MNDSVQTIEVKGFDAYPVKLGDLMRGERATLGKSLLDVQRDLRIKAAFVAAIENTDASAFSTPGFIAGYVRSYARYLGLDPENVWEQFCHESGFSGVHSGARSKPQVARPNRADSPRAKPSGPPQGVGPSLAARMPLASSGDGVLTQFSPGALGSILVLAVLIVGLGYGAWAILQEIQRVDLVPDNANGGIVADIPVVEDGGADEKLARLYRPKELDVPVMVPRDGPISAIDPDGTGALVENNGGLRARETQELLEDATPRVTELAAPNVAVIAAQAAWVRVSLEDGTVLFEQILDAGESFVVPQGAGLAELRAGNSGAVYLSIAGKPYGPIGKDASVAKKVSLAPQTILAAYPEVTRRERLDQLASPRVVTMRESNR